MRAMEPRRCFRQSQDSGPGKQSRRSANNIVVGPPLHRADLSESDPAAGDDASLHHHISAVRQAGSSSSPQRRSITASWLHLDE
jgi:hypothetical protein